MSEHDRSRLPIRRETVRRSGQPDARRLAAGLEPDRASDPARRRAERAAGAHRRRRVRQPEHLRRPDPDAELHADRRGRPALQPVPRHRAVLAHAGGAADRAEQPRGRVRLGRRVRGRVPRLLRDPAAGLRAAASDPAGQRLQHGGLRQVAPDARRPAGPGRAVRPVAERVGLRLLLRVPRRRLEPVGPVPGREPEDHRHSRGVLRRGGSVLLPRRDGRPHHRVAARGPRTGRRQAVLRLLLDRLQPRPAPRREGVGGQVQGQVRPGMGPAPRGDLRPPEGARGHPGRRRADPARRGVPGVGRRARQAEAVLRPPDGGLRRVLGERRPQRRSGDRRDRRARRARQHADPLDLGRQRRQHGGDGHRLVQRADDAERHPAHRRDAAPALRALRRARRVGRLDHGPALRGGVGVGGEHAVPVGQAGRLAPRRDAQPAGRALARPHHRRRRAALASSPTSSTWRPRSSTSPGSPRPTPSTGSSRSRCTGPRSPRR